MTQASKLITCAVILHNLAIQFGDSGDWIEAQSDESDEIVTVPDEPAVPTEPARAQQEHRRNQFLRFFTRE
jgi:hypothetical protein